MGGRLLGVWLYGITWALLLYPLYPDDQNLQEPPRSWQCLSAGSPASAAFECFTKEDNHHCCLSAGGETETLENTVIPTAQRVNKWVTLELVREYQLTADISEEILLGFNCLDSSNEVKLLGCVCNSAILHWLIQNYFCPKIPKHLAHKVTTQPSLWILWDPHNNELTLLQHIF